MATQKTYINKVCQEYGLTLSVNGENVHVNFKGGKLFPKRTYGKYSTENPAIQNALETHPLYGKDWEVESITYLDSEPVSPIQEPELIEPIPAQVSDSRIIKETVSTNNARVVLEPKNVQQAKDWLNRHEKVPFNKMKNRDDVLSVATELNIQFANI